MLLYIIALRDLVLGVIKTKFQSSSVALKNLMTDADHKDNHTETVKEKEVLVVII